MTFTTSGGQGLRPLPPTAEADDPIIAALRALLPDRSAEDRASGIIRLSFGQGEQATTLMVPVLSVGANRVWREEFKATMSSIFEDIEADDTGAVVLRLVQGETDRQMALLAAYNPAMLGKAYIEAMATEEQVLDAFMGVTAAAFPLPVKLGRILLGNREVARWVRLELVRILYSSSLTSSPPSTDGPPASSTTT